MVKQNDGESLFRLLADNAPVLIWRADRSMGCDWFNRPWLEFTGRSLDQELGFGWADGVHPDDREAVLSLYRDAFTRAQPLSATYRLRRADGQFRWLLDNGRPFNDENDAFAGYFGSCTDVHEMVTANDALARAAQDHAEAVAQRDHLLHEVQHRVRNNLQLILSIIDMQARAEDAQSRRALELVAGRVRSIAKAQALLLDPTGKAQIDLGEYVSSLARGAAGSAQHVSVEAPPPTVQVPISRAVPLGLMINEILATRTPGEQDDPASIRLVQADGEVRLEIAFAAPMEDAVRRGSSSQLIERLGAQAGARLERLEGEPQKIILHIAHKT
ncbi:MAG: PAS domain-containing protein [Beijerinckiaceae bacterium]|nr:PAS domain-containing protein [Beijerinckiaceae bacterium]